MATFLRDNKVLGADVIAVQEPWRNEISDTTHQPAKATHQLLYPGKNEQGTARVCMFISKRIDTASWSHSVVSQDYQVLKISYHRGEETRQLYIHNIYNEPRSGTFQRLRGELGRLNHQDQAAEHVVVGDMNTHHPAWGGPGTAMEAEAEELLEVVDEGGLELATEEGTVTWERGVQRSVIDLTFISSILMNRIVCWERADDVQHDSDHWPIRTCLDVATKANEPPKRRNWKATDYKIMLEFLEKHLVVRDLSLATHRRIKLEMGTFLAVVRRAIEESTPWARPSQWSNSDFGPECREMVKTVRALRRRYTQTHDPDDWIYYTIARNEKKRLVGKALKIGHRRRVQKATEAGPRGMWRLAKWARSRRGAYEQGITPTLISPSGRRAETVEDKAELFQEAFFPEPPPADLSDITDQHQYPEPIPLPKIERHEIETAIRATPPDKAPGEDGIPNSLWHKLIAVTKVREMLYQLFNACVRTGYNPKQFQKSITVVLRKPGEERDYCIPKSYRPVALLNTLGKILEAVIAKRISHAVEEYGLLPDTHLGGRKGISTDHAVQLMIDRIRTSWGRGLPVVSLLLLDVVGAYDNVSHARLQHILRKRRLGCLAPWIMAFLRDRSTRIRMPEGISRDIPTPTGIPQGSPLSPILYLLYNADLIERCTEEKMVTANGWVDDVCIMATGISERSTIGKLQRACRTAADWASKHASRFDVKKYKLIHFVNPQSTVQPQYSPLRIPREGVVIEASRTSERYLGVWFDPELNFKEHCNHMLARAGKSLAAIQGIAGSTWGTSLVAMRQIYQAVVVPQMLFGVAAWFQAGIMPAKERNKVIQQFVTVQKRAACLISGAFRTTAAEALNVELWLLPVKLQMERLAAETAIRIRTGPEHAIPEGLRRKRPISETKLGGQTPLEIQAWTKNGCLVAPPGSVAGHWESRWAFTRAPWHKPPEVFIEEREQATATHNATIQKDDKPLVVYTDGSGYQSQVGAAAVVPDMGVKASRHLGPESVSTVYAAELLGIQMALETVKRRRETRRWRERIQHGVVIFSDSQAALKALLHPRMASGQVYQRECFRLLEWYTREGISVAIRWIPAHEGIPGNEAADRTAKEAATGSGQQSGTTVWLASAAKRKIRGDITQKWLKMWEKAPEGKPTKRLVRAPTRKVLSYWKGLRKATASVMMQMRTGRIGLSHYLSRIGVRESAWCGCRLGSQTPQHVLLACPLLTELRKMMWRKLEAKKIPRTLGMDELLSEPKASVAIADFMVRTGLLSQFNAVDEGALGTTNEDNTVQGI